MNVPHALVNQVISLNLSAIEQVNLIQIVREALSNICRHAHAKYVDVTIVHIPNSINVKLTIADDGVGITEDFDQTQHHGLKIMQERVKSLGGSLTINENKPCGTKVEASFSPRFLSDH